MPAAAEDVAGLITACQPAPADAAGASQDDNGSQNDNGRPARHRGRHHRLPRRGHITELKAITADHLTHAAVTALFT
jgi:hypothetical protein